MSVTLTNAEKQARYVNANLGVDGAKVGFELNLNAGTRAKMGRLARNTWLYNNRSCQQLVKHPCPPARSRPAV
jgi:hypothetical protein